MSIAIIAEEETEAIVLRPRPYARHAGYLRLVPLLPKRAPLRSLPAEIWTKILMMSMVVTAHDDNVGRRTLHVEIAEKKRTGGSFRSHPGWKLALVCKLFKDIIHPLIYHNCRILSIQTLQGFYTHLFLSDQKWDSLRRIQYSTPGRWVRSLDLHDLITNSRSDVYAVDAILAKLFPLLPFLVHLHLNPSIQMSKRAMISLSSSECTRHIKTLRGVRHDAAFLGGLPLDQDPLTELVNSCHNLEELEVLGSGLDDTVSTDFPKMTLPTAGPPLHLERLRSLTLLSTPFSELLFRLLHCQLPSLCDVMITPYGDLPFSLVSQFLLTHGPSIRKLILHTPKSWPTTAYPIPSSLLLTVPNLTLLSIEHPLPSLALLHSQDLNFEHQLECLWIFRPMASFRDTLQNLLPRLPNLKEVRVRDVRWARRGISASALETGFQAEMRVWRRILAGRSVKLLDADGRQADM